MDKQYFNSNIIQKQGQKKNEWNKKDMIVIFFYVAWIHSTSSFFYW